MNVFSVPSPNFGYPPGSQGRGGEWIVAIVDHIAEGTGQGLDATFKNRLSGVSTHFAVMQDGSIHQYVAQENAAYGAGLLNAPDTSLEWLSPLGWVVNQRTLHIEHEGYTGVELTPAQIGATIELHRYLVRKWAIPVDRDHIVGHYRLDSVNRQNCPGSAFPWDRLFGALQGETPMPTIIDFLNLLWDKLSAIQADSTASPQIATLAEEAKQQGVVAIKKAIGLQ